MKPEDLSDLAVMALTVYAEARGEPYAGQVAVASVIYNRAKKGGWWGDTIKGVCLKPYQFSCWLKTDPNYRMLLDIAQDLDQNVSKIGVLGEIMGICKGILDGSIPPSTEATHYHTKNISPKWKDSLTKLDEVGHHVFYG